MCGFVVSCFHKHISWEKNTQSGSDTNSRGPDYYQKVSIEVDNKIYIFEFSHLFITPPKKIQPIESKKYILVINGEIYNYKSIAKSLNLSENQYNDSYILFKHIEKFGIEKTYRLLNGMFSGVILNKVSGECFAFIDHIGKKPLVMWNNQKAWHIGTGIDTNYVDNETQKFHALKPGISKVDLISGKKERIIKPGHQIKHQTDLLKTIINAVEIRIPENRKFAVSLSGGLDSSIIAYVIEKILNKKPCYYILADELPKNVISLCQHLSIPTKRLILVTPSTQNILLKDINETCKIVKSYNPSIISNGVATLILCRKIYDDGIQILLSGEGADEYFCGYQAMYNETYNVLRIRNSLIKNLHFTELRRLDLISSYHALEARCPFLDIDVTDYALSINTNKHCNIKENRGKIILRDLFRKLLPDSIINAKKEPFDITSGLQKNIIQLLTNNGKTERDELHSILKNHFKYDSFPLHHDYFSKYPEFDAMIDDRNKKYTNYSNQ